VVYLFGVLGCVGVYTWLWVYICSIGVGVWVCILVGFAVSVDVLLACFAVSVVVLLVCVVLGVNCVVRVVCCQCCGGVAVCCETGLITFGC